MTTERSLLDAFAAERDLSIEEMSNEALAGQLILSERGKLNAMLAVKQLDESHPLRRAILPLSLVQDSVFPPDPIA